MEFLPPEIMLDILLKVEAENPLPFRCVSKFWKSLTIDPYFMETHISRLTTAIFDLLKDASELYSDFKLQYIENNILMREDNAPDAAEIRMVLNSFDEVQRHWDTVEKLCDEEKEKNEGDLRTAILNHMMVAVIYMKVNFNVIRDIMQNVEDRMRCYQRCMQIYRN
jgi:hypothetical protein